MRKGAYKDVGAVAPLVPGYEVSGVVTTVPSIVRLCERSPMMMQVGPSVPTNLFAVGDEVFGAHDLCERITDSTTGYLPLDVGGGCSEFVSIGFEYLGTGRTVMRRLTTTTVRKPPSVTFEEAAAAVQPGLRAYNTLLYQANIRAGDFVLITNGASVPHSQSQQTVPRLMHVHIALGAHVRAVSGSVGREGDRHYHHLGGVQLPTGPQPEPLYGTHDRYTRARGTQTPARRPHHRPELRESRRRGDGRDRLAWRRLYHRCAAAGALDCIHLF